MSQRWTICMDCGHMEPGLSAIACTATSTGLHGRIDVVAVERLREAIEAASKELGVPFKDYPAPVAAAVDILRTALDGKESP